MLPFLSQEFLLILDSKGLNSKTILGMLHCVHCNIYIQAAIEKSVRCII